MAGNPGHNQCGKQLGKLLGTLSHDAPLLRCSFYNPAGQGYRTGCDTDLPPLRQLYRNSLERR
ncbi:hypothetical protein ALP40_100617 [Pseudomonas viridiflava]|uniref:Uncharacterized protein n=1 Tax=Pseudomonas viridiflava TaxID=33069 RepID=A0A3M5PBK7_PSEVI|nr:hypothetical protein ALP40_100617 [Pseudomonas viridiflava]